MLDGCGHGKRFCEGNVMGSQITPTVCWERPTLDGDALFRAIEFSHAVGGDSTHFFIPIREYSKKELRQLRRMGK